ncbi:Ig-like domain-containing protein, partial [Croceicoccus bisphenolivorans]|uniref:Ig-like domain-containing protein n=1 Tax=Croceicoccus bisphenolivorans TaxID=1783232 RepID=UPI000AE00043
MGTSALNTPQAGDDYYEVLEDAVVYLKVLDNDQGGASKTLYSLYDGGMNSAEVSSAISSGGTYGIETSLGALATIVMSDENAGTIEYDASALDWLAEGKTYQDTFSYIIQLGNGTYSLAVVTLTVVGTNDAPVVEDVIIGAEAGIVEDGSAFIGSFVGSDVDEDDDASTLIYEIVSGPIEGSVTINGDGTFTFDPGNDFQDLDEGETREVTFTYRANDSHNAQSNVATVKVTVTGTADAPQTVSGSVTDGYIANAIVFRDSNNNDQWDHEEFVDANANGKYDAGEVFFDTDGNEIFTAEEYTFTDEEGNFTDLGGSGRIVLAPVIAPDGTVLTYDISTGEPFTGTMSAPDGSTVVTPLTTIIDALAGDDATPEDIAAAEALLESALGLPSDVSLTDYDPIAVVADSSDPDEIAEAVEIQKTAAEIANILAALDAGLKDAGVDDGYTVAADALATQLENYGESADLSDSSFIESVVLTVADGTTDPIVQAALVSQSSAISQSLANVNQSIEDIDASGDPIAALTQVTSAQIVAQQQLADDIGIALTGGAPLNSEDYEGSALIDLLDAAANEVETIVPQDNSGDTLGAPDRPTIDDGARVNAGEIADGVKVTVSYGDGTGVGEGDTLHLKLDGFIIASYVLTAADVPSGSTLLHEFTVSAATLGSDGSKVLTAQFESGLGELGTTSLPLLFTVDTTSPDAPADLVAQEGTIVTVLEAADGTQITGTTEPGSIVTVTLTNGAELLVKQANVSGGTFTLSLSQSEIEGLGEGYVSYSAVSTDAAGNQSTPSATGQYYYTTQPIIDGSDRLDGPGSYFDSEDDGTVEVSSL